MASLARAENPISLDSLVAETVARNPELKFYQAEIAAARGGRITAGEFANPELSAQLGNKSIDELGGNKLGDGPVWSLSLAQKFEFPGRVNLRKAIANHEIILAQLGLEQFRNALAMRARTLGYKLLSARQQATAAQDVSKRFEDLLAVLVQRDAAGVAPLLERRIIEASAFTLSRRASLAAIAAKNAQFELNQLRGLPVSTPVEVERAPLPLYNVPILESLFANARKRNFELRASMVELGQQGLRVDLSETQKWPSITVAPYVAGEKASDRQTEFGIGVTLPLPWVNKNAGGITTAKARKAQAEVTVNATLREVERKIAETRYTYEVYVADMGKWPADVAETFRDAALKGDENYRLGALPIATYTELQTQYLDSLDAMLATQLNTLEARQQLEMLTGMNLGDAPVLPKSDPEEPAMVVKPVIISPDKSEVARPVRKPNFGKHKR
jgi:outer membrane protein, heavy metal efflux system